MKITGKTTSFIFIVLFVLGLSTVLMRPASAWDDGCTQGFWKNHTDSWPSDILPGDMLVTYFQSAPPDLENDSLMDALRYHGGRGYLGAARILLRTSVAALLNIEHPAVRYHGHDFGFVNSCVLQAEVNAALDFGDRNSMLDLAEELDGYNNWYCPLGD